MFANIINPDLIGTVLRDDNGHKRVHIPYIGDLILSGGDLILSFIPYFLLNKKQKEENRGIKKHDTEKEES